MLMGLMPAPSADSLVMVCGPPPMMNAISGDKAPDKSQGEVTGFLKELGYDSTNVFKF
jgi:cytochrome-b5 reductase